jgi:hypothetical protein
MKWVMWIIMALLLVGFCSASMRVSCEKNSECYLINEEAYCSEGYCFTESEKYLTIEDFQPRNQDFEWGVFSIEAKDYDCNNCLNFAPEKTNWFYEFVHWLIVVD